MSVWCSVGHLGKGDREVDGSPQTSSSVVTYSLLLRGARKGNRQLSKLEGIHVCVKCLRE